MLMITGILLILAVSLATGFFVAQEFAYVAVDRHRLRLLADQGDSSATRALRVTDRLSFTLSGAQLGITVTGLLAGYIAEPSIGRGLDALLGAGGVPTAVSLPVSVAVAVLLATMIQMVLGELAPKNLAIAKPEAVARALARPTLVYLATTGWMIAVFDASSNRLLRALGIEPVEHLAQGATTEDLDRIISRSHTEGLLDTDTYHLLDRGLGFRSLTAADAMVPRVDVVTLQADDPAVRVVDLLDTGHTRFPVIGESVDDLLGVVSVGDVIALPVDRRATTRVADLVSPPPLVTAMLALPRVLEHLRGAHQQLACVLDEYGGFAGIVTLEDIAEELVGDILDEDDLPEPTAVAQSDGSWLVPARWRLDEVAEATGTVLPHSPRYDTLSGLVMARLGHVPSVGEQITVELPAAADAPAGRPRPQVTLQVLRVARHVPLDVRMTPTPLTPGQGAAVHPTSGQRASGGAASGQRASGGAASGQRTSGRAGSGQAASGEPT